MNGRLAMGLLVVLGIDLAGCGGGTTKTKRDSALPDVSGADSEPRRRADAATPARSETLTFEAQGLNLVGTLTLPEGASERSRVPGVVLVHGSGPHDRDQVLKGQLAMSFPPIAVFEQIARGLQERDIAVLRYDKRTCGPFNDCADNGYSEPAADVTPTDFLEDALAAGRTLAARPEVAADRVVYAGHSQGGVLALRALSTSGTPFDAAVNIAGNRSRIVRLLRMQARRLRQVLEASGASAKGIEAQVGPVETLADQLEALRGGSSDVPEMLGGAPAAFWTDLFAIEDRISADARELRAPFLVLVGGYDWNVPPSEADGWRATLDEAPSTRTEVRVIDEVTHALNRISQPDWIRIQPADVGDRVDPRVIDAVAAFVEDVPGD